MSDYPKTGSYKPEELRFAATARCKCGAGLAYPPDDTRLSIKDGASHWDCSAVLMGQAPPTKDHPTFPFMFYEIKSEDQPSARGATTRPEGAPPRVDPPRPPAPATCPHCGK